MVRSIFRFFGVSKSQLQKELVFVPNTSKLPGLWQPISDWHAVPDLQLLDDAPTDALIELCDDYWKSFLDDDELDFDANVRVFRDSRVHIRALEILATRDAESLAWARARLKNDDYVVREEAAMLIGKLARHGFLGEDARVVTTELAAVATRPRLEDTKEIQANGAALEALRVIGGPKSLATVTEIIQCPYWDEDELQFQAVRLLGELVDRSFSSSDDPVSAAKDWLKTNP